MSRATLLPLVLAITVVSSLPAEEATALVHPRALEEVTLSGVESPLQNGNALHALVSSVKASREHPSRIRLGAGTFDLGERPLLLPSFLDLEGSGREETTLILPQPPPLASRLPSAAIQLAANSSLGRLQVVVGDSHAESPRGLHLAAGSTRVYSLGLVVRGDQGEARGVTLASASQATLQDVSIEVQASEMAAAVGLEQASSVTPELVGVRLQVGAVRGPAQAVRALPGSRLVLLDGQIEARSRHGEVVGVGLGARAQLQATCSRITAIEGRRGSGLQVLGPEADLVLRSTEVRAEGATLSAIALEDRGGRSHLDARATRFLAKSPGSSRGLRALRSGGEWTLEGCRVDASTASLEGPEGMVTESICSDWLGSRLFFRGTMRWRSCSGMPIQSGP